VEEIMKKIISSLLLIATIAGQSALAMEAGETRRFAQVATQTGNFIDMGTQTDGKGIMTMVIPVVVDLNPEDASDTLSNGWYMLEDTGAGESEISLIPAAFAKEFLKELIGVDPSSKTLPQMLARYCKQTYGPPVKAISNNLLTALVKKSKQLVQMGAGPGTVGLVVTNSKYTQYVNYILPIVSPAGKLVVVVIVVMTTYKLYNKYFKRIDAPKAPVLLADQWISIKANLQLYLDAIQDHMFCDSLESITYDLSEIDELRVRLSDSLYGVDDTILTDMKRVRDSLNKKILPIIVGAMRKTLPVDVYYQGLDSTYRDNLSEGLVDTFGIAYNKVYEFLGVTKEKGMAMNIHEIARLIDAKTAALRAEGHADNDLYYLHRQLNYMFGSVTQKEEYEAFLGGKQAVAKITKTLPVGHERVLERKMQDVADILVVLDELIKEAESDGWVAIDAR